MRLVGWFLLAKLSEQQRDRARMAFKGSPYRGSQLGLFCLPVTQRARPPPHLQKQKRLYVKTNGASRFKFGTKVLYNFMKEKDNKKRICMADFLTKTGKLAKDFPNASAMNRNF